MPAGAVIAFAFSGSGRQGGEHGSSRSSSATAAIALSSLSVAPSASNGDADGDEESYEEDQEWEDEEENEGEIDREVAAERRTRQRGEQGKRGGTVGPVSLEISFRESFASVNDVLSAIASGTAEGNITTSSTSPSNFRGGGGVDGVTGCGRKRLADRRRDPESSSSLRGEAEDDQYVPQGSAVSPLPPPCRRRQSRKKESRKTASGGDEVSELGARSSKNDFPVTPGPETGQGSPATAFAGGFGVGSSEEQMPVEMSGMLQRYSEMMVKVVQVGNTPGD